MKRIGWAFLWFSIGLLSTLRATDLNISTSTAKPKLEKATFAGGCFWCMEPPFEKLKGVVSVTSGYTGGWKKNPAYEEVGAGKTGHAESVDILFDPSQITYTQLLDTFWRNINPTQANGQFVDL